MSLQRRGIDGTETLLDHHLAAFDEWLRSQLSPWESLSGLSYFLTAFTLIDQVNVDPKGFDWEMFSILLENQWDAETLILVARVLTESAKPLNGTESRITYFRIVSKFLTDPKRAGHFLVNSWTYMKLTKQLLIILRNE